MNAQTKNPQFALGFIGFRPQWLSLLIFAMLFNCLKAQAQTGKNFATKQPFLFEENNGQLMDANGTALSDIKYYGKDGGVYVYCKSGMLSFVFTKVEKENGRISEATGQPVEAQCLRLNQASTIAGLPQDAFNASLQRKISISRMDLILIGSNPNPVITGSDQQEYYENFYTTGDADHGIINVHTYKTLTYKNIYPNIDMILNVAPSSAKATAGESGMEYSFLVHPGGNVSDIKLRWNGADKEEALKNGGIKYANMLGNLEESAPKSFVEGEMIESKFVRNKGDFGFKVESYDKKKDLVIDPSLVWATYYGGTDADQAFAICTDARNNEYITGWTLSISGIATSGAYQTSTSGAPYNNNAFLAKFSNSCTLLWATYYGGSGSNGGFGICTDISGNVFITGYVGSPDGIATSGAYKTAMSGNGEDAFLAKFDSSGSILWGTFYGGQYNDEGHGVSADASGNVYMTGTTESDSGIATFGAYQTSLAGIQDAFLAKFSSSGNLSWATYFGGSGVGSGNGLGMDAAGYVYMTGSTGSNSGIATSGAYQSSLAGSKNAYLAKFSSSGSLSWATYYGGNGTDNASSLSIDVSGNIYIAGTTTSSNGIATSGAYQTSFAGYYQNSSNVFLAKFYKSGNLDWATYYGGNGGDKASGVSTDFSGNVYITGTAGSAKGIATNGAYQTSNNSASGSAFLAKFGSNGDLYAATYFGGTKSGSVGNGVSTNASGDVFITGETNSSSGIASFGAYQTSSGGFIDAFVAKFYFKTYQNDAGIASILSPVSVFCSTQNVNVRLKNFGATELDSVKIGWMVNRKVQSAYRWYGKLKPDSTSAINIGSFSFLSDNDTIVAWTANPNGLLDSFPANDTAVIVVAPKPYAGGNHIICNGSSIILGSNPINGCTYSWTSKPTGFTSTLSNPSVKPTTKTIYYVTETVTVPGCSTKDSAIITVNPSPSAGFSLKNVCLGDSAVFVNSSSLASAYLWYFGDGKTSIDSTPLSLKHLYSSSGTYAVALKVISYNGCTDSVSKNLTIYPSAGFSFIQSCPGDSTFFTNSDPTSISYYWSFGDGKTSILKNPTHLYAGTGTYLVSLKDSNTVGCTDTVSKTVTISSCVWPGDANYDKVDNIYDVLAVGIAYNDTGSKRVDSTTQWYAHPCIDWSNSFKSGSNYKHADCNGDGKVDSLDLGAIVRNYSQTHSKSGGASSGNPSDPALYLATSKDSVGTQDTLQIQINLGTSAKQVSDVYGLCFSVKYDPVNVNQSKGIMADFSKCWLGTLNKNLIYIIHNDSSSGILDIGITRTDHKNVSGYGQLGVLTIITPDNVGGKREVRKELNFDIENVKAIDNVESDISLFTSGDSTLFYGYSGIRPIGYNLDNFKVYPNPANSILHLDAGKDFISEIAVSNILGQRVSYQKSANIQRTGLNIESLVPGTYFINIITDKGMGRARFVKE